MGSSNRGRKGGIGGAGDLVGNKSLFDLPTGISKSSLQSLSRSQLETLHIMSSANNMMRTFSDIDRAEAIRRATSLGAGQKSTSTMINAIYKNTRKKRKK